MREYVVVGAGIALHGFLHAQQIDPRLPAAISDMAGHDQAVPTVIACARENDDSLAAIIPHQLLPGSHNRQPRILH